MAPIICFMACTQAHSTEGTEGGGEGTAVPLVQMLMVQTVPTAHITN